MRRRPIFVIQYYTFAKMRDCHTHARMKGAENDIHAVNHLDVPRTCTQQRCSLYMSAATGTRHKTIASTAPRGEYFHSTSTIGMNDNFLGRGAGFRRPPIVIDK